MLKKVHPVITALILMFLCSHCYARDYWLIDEFLNAHPQQRHITTNFNYQVQNPARPIGRSIREPVKISIIYPEQKQSDYWRRSVTSFEARMQELDIPYQINKFYTDPTAEIRRQEQLILAAVEDNADYLIITLYSNRHRRMLERIIAAGKPKVILQNITTPIKVWRNNQPFLYVGFDHAIGTRMLANWFIEQQPAVKDYALVYWAKGYVSEARGDHFIEIMRNETNYRLSGSYYTNTTRGSGYTAAANIISRTKSMADNCLELLC